MTILVTGAGGYIGSTLVPMLLAEGHRVRAVDRFYFGRDRLAEHPKLEIVQEDVRHLSVDHLAGCTGVIDLAALSNDPSGELFQDSTWAINHRARARCCELAKQAGATRYVLPSSCSIYGWLDADVVADETYPTNPLTTYARANEKAEHDTLALADETFCATAVRQATVYGYSPRMRFDLAINGMSFGAWKTGKLPLMRDGSQWRPMVHVADTARALMFMLEADADKVGGQVFNIGSAANVYQIGPLGEAVAGMVGKLTGREISIEWYGDPDHRSYRVGFDRIEALGWRAEKTAEDGVAEIVEKLEAGALDKTTETLTLDWYKTLVDWQRRIREVEMHGGIVDLG